LHGRDVPIRSLAKSRDCPCILVDFRSYRVAASPQQFARLVRPIPCFCEGYVYKPTQTHFAQLFCTTVAEQEDPSLSAFPVYGEIKAPAIAMAPWLCQFADLQRVQFVLLAPHVSFPMFGPNTGPNKNSGHGQALKDHRGIFG
jgi:hypothetical protein